MAGLRAESDTLLLADPTLSRSTVHVSVTHPSPIEEETLGKLYVVVDIETNDRANHEVIAAMLDELKSAYYHATDVAVDQAFESALQRVNARLHRFITDGVTLWLENFHSVIAVVKHDTVFMSSVGRMQAYLFRENRITDVLRTGGMADKLNPLKIFSSVLVGHLVTNDRLMISTPSLLDFFSLEKLKRIIVDSLPSATVANVEATLLGQPTHMTFGAIFFAFLPAENSAVAVRPVLTNAPGARASAPQRSMDDLIAKERSTEKLLSPSILPNIPSLLRSGWERSATFIRTSVFRRPPKRRLPTTLQTTTRFHDQPAAGPAPWVRAVQRLGLQLLLGLMAIPRLIGRLFGRRRRAMAQLREVPQQSLGTVARTIRWLRSMTNTQRYLLLAALVALFVLSQGIIALSNGRSQKARTAAAQQNVNTVEDDIRKASAALTYDDYTGAKKLLDEAAKLINGLPNRSKTDRELRKRLTASVDDVRQETRRVKTPAFSAVLSLADPLGGATPTSLALVGPTALIPSDGPTTIRVTLDDHPTAKKLTAGSATRFATAQDVQTAILGTTGNTLAEAVIKSDAIKPLEVTFPNVDRQLVSGAVFQARLYLIDTKNNAIIRHNRSGATFGAGQLWLKQNVDVRTGTSLAVDGSIYLATSHGDLLRFTAGKKDDVTFETVDPPLQHPTQIWTNDRSSLLYVLEPLQRRLLIYRKTTRNLISQYVDPGLEDAKGFAVDEAKGLIYVVTKNQLLKFASNAK